VTNDSSCDINGAVAAKTVACCDTNSAVPPLAAIRVTGSDLMMTYNSSNSIFDYASVNNLRSNVSWDPTETTSNHNCDITERQSTVSISIQQQQSAVDDVLEQTILDNLRQSSSTCSHKSADDNCPDVSFERRLAMIGATTDLVKEWRIWQANREPHVEHEVRIETVAPDYNCRDVSFERRLAMIQGSTDFVKDWQMWQDNRQLRAATNNSSSREHQSINSFLNQQQQSTLAENSERSTLASLGRSSSNPETTSNGNCWDVAFARRRAMIQATNDLMRARQMQQSRNYLETSDTQTEDQPDDDESISGYLIVRGCDSFS
jgi:hypothetical protein